MDAEARAGTVAAMSSTSLCFGPPIHRVTCLVAVFAVSAAVTGCGGVVTHVQSSPFTSEDAALFDQGISYLAEPGSLGGAWEADWRESLEGRVQRADAIAVVTGHTYREDLTPTREQLCRLSMTVERTLFGELEEAVDLVTRQEDPGYPTVEGRERQILERSFVLFIKWRERTGAGGEAIAVEAAFHMEPGSDSVVARVEELVDRMRRVDTGATTRVHYN